MKNTVLITGANRGIGLEFTIKYAQEGWHVLACCRKPAAAHALQALANQFRNIELVGLDVADFSQIDIVATQLKDHNIDILINNAGVYPESSLEDLPFEDWQAAFKINTMAPLKMVDAFLPHLMRGSQKKIATLSSKMGSIDDNTSGGSYIYRTSKVAVNMMMKSLSIDLKKFGISVVTLHPGWVKTDMGGPNGLISTHSSVTGMRQVISQLNLANSGQFISYDGKKILW